MRHIIWRNRASAILGLFVMLVPFTGFPEIMRDSLVVLSGFLIALFGFYHGSGHYALVEESFDKEEIKNKSSRRIKDNNGSTSSDQT